MTIRSFVALIIPEEELKKIIDIRNDVYGFRDKARWEPVNKLHITLKFLGDTDEKILDQLSNNFESVLNNFRPINCSFSEFGLFKKDGHPRILWAGLKENKILLDLASELENVSAEYGFQKENRKFKPHITILRVRGSENIDSIYKLSRTKIDSVEFTALRSRRSARCRW